MPKIEEVVIRASDCHNPHHDWRDVRPGWRECSKCGERISLQDGGHGERNYWPFGSPNCKSIRENDRSFYTPAVNQGGGVIERVIYAERRCSCTAIWLIAIGAMLYSCSTAKSQPLPQPKPPGGVCPSNYYTSGQYCVPNDQARNAVPKIGATCPSGYYTSGQFCVSQQERRR